MKKIFTAADKARIALEALKGVDSNSKVASNYGAHPIQVGLWKKTLSEKAHTIFDTQESETNRIKQLEQEKEELYRIIGVRDAELVWLQKKSGS